MDRAAAHAATDAALTRAADLAREFVAHLDDRPVGATASLGELRARLGGVLPATGEDPLATLDALAEGVRGGLVGSAGPRYLGFVVGGGLPAALGAD